MNDCNIMQYIENNCNIMIMLISLVYQCLVISHHVSNHLSITAPGTNRYAACTTPNRNSWPRLSENGATKKILFFISLSHMNHILMTINEVIRSYTNLKLTKLDCFLVFNGHEWKFTNLHTPSDSDNKERQIIHYCKSAHHKTKRPDKPTYYFSCKQE